MQQRLLDFLRCAECRTGFQVLAFESDDGEVISGILYCQNGHAFPVIGGIPRMLPDSLRDYWPVLSMRVPNGAESSVAPFVAALHDHKEAGQFDRKTKVNFSNEWDNHDIGGRTWTMELSDRIQWFFLDPIRLGRSDLPGKLMLDAGCGNGSQSVAYTEFGLEVVALDLSTGLEKGYAFRSRYKGARPEKVHFVQADLQKPPLAEGIFDIIHSAGVLHHTPNTEYTFRELRPLLKDTGTFYVWLYKYERVVTPIVNTIRLLTTKIPEELFVKIARLASVPFIGFCWTVNKLGIRRYQTPTRNEAKIAVHDIFGAPYAHYHDFEEVVGWFNSVGLSETWLCNDDRRGFGVCGCKGIGDH